MGKITRYIIVAGFFLCSRLAIAQPGFYVPTAGKIFFNGDTATIFFNVINYGSFGVGKKAFVNFTAPVWENAPLSLITDESNGGNGASGTGGWIRFLSDSIRQQLIGGYNAAIKSGPAFCYLQIQNPLGVELTESSAKVRKEILLSEGLVYLKDYILAVGDNDPGKISGYDSSRYFVTGNKRGAGFLIRENIRSADGRIDFPVGSRDDAYTPAAIKSNSLQGDDYYVNVFDSVKAERPIGNYLFEESVNKTWEIGKRFQPDAGNVEIFLQHLNADEGSFFTLNKRNAYVSRFNGTGWDLGSPQSYPAPGYLTSGTPLTNSGVNNRVFYNTVSSPSYFTKLTGYGDSLLQTMVWFNARRTGYSAVDVYWKTKPEINVQYFIVQRRLSNETDFTNMDTVSSQVNGGISLAELNYSLIDPNSYSGISFYRLKTVNTDTTFFYSNIIAVGGKPGGPLILLWPNPTPDKFYVSCDPALRVQAIVIWNAIGQKIKQENVNGRTIIEMNLTVSGSYLVGFVAADGTIIETKKLIVAR